MGCISVLSLGGGNRRYLCDDKEDPGARDDPWRHDSVGFSLQLQEFASLRHLVLTSARFLKRFFQEFRGFFRNV